MPAEFTIIVADDDANSVRPTNVGAVGQELEKLSALYETLKQEGAELTSSSEVATWSSWHPDAQEAVNELLKGLSFQLWDDTTKTRQVSVAKLQPGEEITDFVTLRFVFEEPGEMVVPVPSVAQIARGKKDAPLRLPGVYSGLISKEMIEALVKELEAMRHDPEEAEEFRTLDSGAYQTMIAALQKAQERLAAAAKDDSENIFLAQLGDYSVRQCHS